ncbi:D-alanine--D-alanine ligase [Candidatus Wolfebacteria bacterium]|nr:D-alanine--D-alanine ligase [Candidatus Wolfebacteria bacterium]
MPKRKIILFFGGESEEHKISILSAKNILRAIDKDRYQVCLVGITRSGVWRRIEPAQLLDSSYDEVEDKDSETEVLFSFSKKMFCFVKKGSKQWIKFDNAFPILHGKNGEDGTIQGFLEIAGINYVGGDVLGSAIGIDKEISKKILQQADLLVAKYLTIQSSEKTPTYQTVSNLLGRSLYVKPARSGSSLGVSRVENEKQYKEALKAAHKVDSKIIVEENIIGREIECAVLGNLLPKVSTLGEVLVKDRFYSYEEKYNATSTTKVIIPAKLTEQEALTAKKLAMQAYKVLRCRGLARVDLFFSKNIFYVNEINTMPGFTNKSIYPKLWEDKGLSYKELVTCLLKLSDEKK